METNQKSVNIGGSFIIEESNPKEIFTPEDFTEEHKMMKDSVTVSYTHLTLQTKAKV